MTCRSGIGKWVSFGGGEALADGPLPSSTDYVLLALPCLFIHRRHQKFSLRTTSSFPDNSTNHLGGRIIRRSNSFSAQGETGDPLSADFVVMLHHFIGLRSLSLVVSRSCGACFFPRSTFSTLFTLTATRSISHSHFIVPSLSHSLNPRRSFQPAPLCQPYFPPPSRNPTSNRNSRGNVNFSSSRVHFTHIRRASSKKSLTLIEQSGLPSDFVLQGPHLIGPASLYRRALSYTDLDRF